MPESFLRRATMAFFRERTENPPAKKRSADAQALGRGLRSRSMCRSRPPRCGSLSAASSRTSSRNFSYCAVRS